MDHWRVCLIMPFLDEARHLPAVLASLEAQTYDRDRLYLIAVDNGSMDGGSEVVRDWLARSDVAGQVIRTEVRSIPHALNRALAHVHPDDYVVRVDAHTIYASGYVETIMRAFAELPSNVWCVGGSPDAIAPPGDFSRTLHAALFRNPMGLGPADYRSSERVRPVQSVYLGAWRPGVLQTLGGFDPGWQANEDAELAERIRRAGGIVYRVPARCSKLITRSASAAVKQWTRYGFWRAQTFKRNPSAMRLRHVAPPVVLLALAALAASPVWWAIGPIAFAHACAVIAYRPRHQTLAITFASVLYFPIVHVGYALGLIAGALIPQRKATKPAAAGMFSGIRGPLTATDPESP